jgi:hypothetical protein
MKNKMTWLYVGLAVLLLITGIVVYKAIFAPKATISEVEEEEMIESLPEADASIEVDITRSKTKDNTVVLSIEGLDSKYESLSYELSYDSQGIVQGVTSAPLDISGKDEFVRDDIYLGTCSRNVCKPHPGVSKISAVIVFTDADGKKSQFSKEYEL